MRKFIKKITWIYIRFVQKILITIFLSLTYILVFPFSWLYLLIFKNSEMSNKFEIKNSYWIKTKDLSTNIDEYTIQS
ncbi:MAG: hypothetical protein C0596_12900 [Marinilabiliales bacterium]|nr:MAG: hypothetical protein C0596_12900 [Marinilabiliales bacterium]